MSDMSPETELLAAMDFTEKINRTNDLLTALGDGLVPGQTIALETAIEIMRGLNENMVIMQKNINLLIEEKARLQDRLEGFKRT